MKYFCTLFDTRYLSRGLALHRSLQKHAAGQFHLFILAMDDNAYRILRELGHPDVTPISLSTFENEELISAKQSRTVQEYCWTCTPAIIRFCILKYSLEECTYLDADTYFFSKPDALFNEMGEKSVLITPHGYAPNYDQSKASGIYCVQFVTFRGNISGMQVLDSWYAQCIQWCYAKVEDGKFGDQKYLDSWPQDFLQVHVSRHLGAGVAPWNLINFDLTSGAGGLQIRCIANGELSEIIFYHFHDLYFDDSGNWFHKSGENGYFIGDDAYQIIYREYLETLYAIGMALKFPEGVDFPSIPRYLNVADFEEALLPRLSDFSQKDLLRNNYSKQQDGYLLNSESHEISGKLFPLFMQSGYNLSRITYWKTKSNPIAMRINRLEDRLSKLENFIFIRIGLSIFRYFQRK